MATETLPPPPIDGGRLCSQCGFYQVGPENHWLCYRCGFDGPLAQDLAAPPEISP